MSRIETPGGPPETDPEAADHGAESTQLQADALPAPPSGGGSRRRPFLVRASIYALAAPVALARVLLRSRPLRWAGQETMSVLGAVFDAAVTAALERLQNNAKLKAFIQTTIHDQIDGLDSRAVAGLVQSQAERLIAALTENPALLRQLVHNAADGYVESLRDDPALVNELVQHAAADYLAALRSRPETVDELIQVIAAQYIAHLYAHPAIVNELVQTVGAQYIAHLHAHPELTDPVVEQAAARLIDRLRADPGELHALIEVVGDRYIAYLRTSPQGVQELLQGQSQTLANEIMGEVRDRSASADQTLENLIRSILGGRPGRRQGSGL